MRNRQAAGTKQAGLARVYVWNTEGLHFSLDEALGFVGPSSIISKSFIGL